MNGLMRLTRVHEQRLSLGTGQSPSARAAQEARSSTASRLQSHGQLRVFKLPTARPPSAQYIRVLTVFPPQCLTSDFLDEHASSSLSASAIYVYGTRSGESSQTMTISHIPSPKPRFDHRYSALAAVRHVVPTISDTGRVCISVDVRPPGTPSSAYILSIGPVR